MTNALLRSYRDFYFRCVMRGCIPVRGWNGRYCLSYNPEDFDNYLARFDADIRRKITAGIPSIRDRESSRVRSIADRAIAQRLRRLKESNPAMFQELIESMR